MIASDLLSRVLSRWERNPPAIYAREADHQLRGVFGILRGQSIVRQVANAAAVDCRECGESCEVECHSGAGPNNLQGFIYCPSCGIDQVPPRASATGGPALKGFVHSVFSGSFLLQAFSGQHRTLPGDMCGATGGRGSDLSLATASLSCCACRTAADRLVHPPASLRANEFGDFFQKVVKISPQLREVY